LFPEYSKWERFVDACIHAAGISLSIAVTAVLVIAAAIYRSSLDVAGVGIYGLGMLAMFVSSACYNFVRRHSLKEIFRRVDHAAIFVMIAGSYTPFTLLKIGGTAGYGMLAAVWIIAAIGVFLKVRFPRRYDRLTLLLYLAQGWVIVVAFNPLLDSVSVRAVALLITGGCLYTIGVVFHLWTGLKFHNAIWHGFVLTAAVCHFGAVFDAVLLT
jgi:hemolysin III